MPIIYFTQCPCKNIYIIIQLGHSRYQILKIFIFNGHLSYELFEVSLLKIMGYILLLSIYIYIVSVYSQTLNFNLLQFARKRSYDVSTNIWRQIKSFVTTFVRFSNENKFPWNRPRPKLVGKKDFSLTFNLTFTVQYIYIYIHIYIYIYIYSIYVYI